MGRTRGIPGERAATRERVLAAAERLFLNRGYLAVTIDDIAEKAGYTRGAVYSSFKNKEEIMFALHERRFENEKSASREAVDHATTDVLTLEALGQSFAREVQRAREWGRAELEFLGAAANRPEIMERVIQQQRQARKEFADFVAETCERLGAELPQEREQFALAVIALQRGLMVEWMIDSTVDIAKIFADTFSLWLQAPRGDEEPRRRPLAGARRSTPRR